MTAEMASAVEPIQYTNYNLVEFQEKNRTKIVTEYGCTEGQADMKLAELFRQASFEVSKPSNIFLSCLPVIGSAVLGAYLSDAIFAKLAPVFQSGSEAVPLVTAAAVSMALVMQVGSVYLYMKERHSSAVYKDQFIDGIPNKNAKGSMEVISGAEKRLFQDIENHRAKMAKKAKPTEPALKAA